jgi:hypothetical protein
VTVNFYRISDDFRVVNKSLGTPLATLSLAFLDTVSLSNPRIVISYNATIATCNYMEFVEAEKYYFFPQPSLGAGGRLYIVGTDDVLMNNRAKILELDAYVVRSESNGNSLMLDSKRPVQANRHCITEPFSQHPFSGDSDVSGIKYVLTVIGGQRNEVEST